MAVRARVFALALAVAGILWVAAMPLVAAVVLADLGLFWLVSGSLVTLVLLGNAGLVVWLWRRRR